MSETHAAPAKGSSLELRWPSLYNSHVSGTAGRSDDRITVLAITTQSLPGGSTRYSVIQICECGGFAQLSVCPKHVCSGTALRLCLRATEENRCRSRRFISNAPLAPRRGGDVRCGACAVVPREGQCACRNPRFSKLRYPCFCVHFKHKLRKREK